MKSEEGHSALTPRVIVTLYLCVGMLWLGAQAGVLGYFDVSLNRQSLRWQIGLFIVWLLATALIALWFMQRKARADQRGRETAQELELVVRHAPAGMARVHVGGAEIVWANAKLAGWLGCSVESLRGQDFRVLVPVNDQDDVALQLQRLLDGSTDYFQVLRQCVNAGTGKVTPVLCTTSRVAASGVDGPVALVCVLQDLSEMVSARNAMMRSETMLRLALEGSGNGVWEWDALEQRLNFSTGMSALLRYQGQDLAREFDFHQRLHPEDAAGARAQAEQALEQGSMLVLTARLLCFDGLYRWFRARGQAYKDESGRLIRISGLLSDQTASREADERSRLASTVVDNTIEGVVVTDAHSRILSVNHAFTKLLGFSEAEMLGKTPRMFKSGRHDKAFYDAMWASMHATGHWQGEIWNRRKNGEVFPERMSLSAVKDANDKVTHYVCMFTDISAEKAREQQLEFLAHRDTLTGLPNRSQFTRMLGEAVELSQSTNRRMAVLLFNIDRFKDVNDSYGHSIGDEVLRHVSVQMQGALRHGDIIGRLAGDEICVVAQSICGRDSAVDVAERLMAAAGQPWTTPDGLSVVVSVSAGICLYPDHALTADDLLQGAHAAVYGAKARGSNAWCFFHENMTQAARERLALEARLRRALELGHMRLYYQPQIDLATGRVVGAEALLRWLDPEEGLISPARFIPVAENSGVIGPLGLWVLGEACRQGQQWRAAGLPDLAIAVNVSLHQFLLTDIAGATAEALNKSGFPASLLELEITESALAEKPEEALAVLNRLRELGLRLAIDDFGTGYSSLAHLKRFPLDLLKIDQGFIRDIPHSADDMTISSSVIALGHAMGLKVLAEGVETQEQLSFLQQKGCDYFQGYFCSRPLPAEDFTRLLEKTREGQPLVAVATAG
ncbi:EAL domain-containing protein [Comamonas thiooxydans]|uniref:EAL domain-containing protein n=1 Tax=Comamonas thiooxydans TaxID=363952 RepID=A0AA42PWT3_9BURK|nr:GGDEF and EAL domain-containing protein [Comamonas thiooxydans]MDH1333058.1 EAL domain-containing protein [Comamonas thiooxydans]MDH1742262.1 EAL domain-containing protein [Comamonas thiooxydans]MDH1788850.1 EAL domain-containing protein [Comamonas thiooxydans]